MFAPGKTPKDIIAKLYGEIQRILADEEVKSRFVDQGADPVLGMTPEAFSTNVKTEIAQWSKVAKELNLKPQ
jgi:tripartite-type tricarboxylate transporter receptor subunit TctC